MNQVEVKIEQAYHRYFPIIRTKCERMMGNSADAQDIAQETFTRLWSKRKTLKDSKVIPSWIYMTSTRITVDFFRKLQRCPEYLVDVASGDEAVDWRDTKSQLQARQTLLQLGSKIPTKELEVAILSRVDGLTHHEITQVLGTSERTVRRLLSKFDERTTGKELF